MIESVGVVGIVVVIVGVVQQGTGCHTGIVSALSECLLHRTDCTHTVVTAIVRVISITIVSILIGIIITVSVDIGSVVRVYVGVDSGLVEVAPQTVALVVATGITAALGHTLGEGAILGLSRVGQTNSLEIVRCTAVERVVQISVVIIVIIVVIEIVVAD